MKYEWKKEEKEFYRPKNKPEIVTVPKFNYFMLSGKGNPNSELFGEAIGILYSLAYAVKMLPKKGTIPEGYYEYTVYPLEGIWDLAEEARNLETLDKNSLVYTIMIKQPNFVTEELAKEVLESVKVKKSHPLLKDVNFGSVEDGLCIQMMHLGSYDKETESFEIMENFCIQHNLRRKSKIHREIYISDPRKTEPDKLKTILRFSAEYID